MLLQEVFEIDKFQFGAQWLDKTINLTHTKHTLNVLSFILGSPK